MAYKLNTDLENVAGERCLRRGVEVYPHMSPCPAKGTSWHGHPPKTQISLHICTFWSVTVIDEHSSLCGAKIPMFLQAEN